MPRTSRGFRGVRSRGVRRGMEWTGAASNIATLAAGTVTPFYIVLPSQARGYTNPTLVRTRGNFHASTSTAASVYGAIGLISWQDIDDGLPASLETPAPYTRPDLDWIFHHYFHLTGTAFGTAGADVQMQGDIFDSKAMRKLKVDEGVMLVLQNASAAAMLYGFGVRCLIKE